MTTIMCLQHPDCKAIYVCQHCGFVCEKHIKEESDKKHKLLLLDQSINGLYNAMASKEKLSAESALISLTKLRIIAFLDNEKAILSRLARDTQKIINKHLADELGMDAQKLSEKIMDSIKLSQPSYTKINELKAKKLNDLMECIIKEYNKHIKCTKHTIQVLYKNSIYLHFKWHEEKWDQEYEKIKNKTWMKNQNTSIAEKIMKNDTTYESNINIIDFNSKQLEDDGAIAIGYALKKNNTLQTVSITSDIHLQQQDRRHWSRSIGHLINGKCHPN